MRSRPRGSIASRVRAPHPRHGVGSMRASTEPTGKRSTTHRSRMSDEARIIQSRRTRFGGWCQGLAIDASSMVRAASPYGDAARSRLKIPQCSTVCFRGARPLLSQRWLTVAELGLDRKKSAVSRTAPESTKGGGFGGSVGLASNVVQVCITERSGCKYFLCFATHVTACHIVGKARDWSRRTTARAAAARALAGTPLR